MTQNKLIGSYQFTQDEKLLLISALNYYGALQIRVDLHNVGSCLIAYALQVCESKDCLNATGFAGKKILANIKAVVNEEPRVHPINKEGRIII